MKQAQVSIIILNWNGVEDTIECLKSVFKNSYKNYSTYVIDNASKKNELAEIKTFCKKIKHKKSKTNNTPKLPIFFIQNKKNLGFAEGNNIGIRKSLESGADYIFTLNNDTVVDKNFLLEAIKCIQQKSKKPIGIVGSKMINYYNHNKLDNVGHQLLSTGDTMPRGRNENPMDYQLQATTLGTCAGAALYSSEMLSRIGLFDKDFFLNYEDSDLSLRAIVQGWKTINCPKSVVYHKISTSVKKVISIPYRTRNERNQIWAYLHNTPLPVIMLNLPWIILRDILALVLSILSFRWDIAIILIKSRIAILISLPKIYKKHREVLKHKSVSSLWYWSQQSSFLMTYWRYFMIFVMRREKK